MKISQIPSPNWNLFSPNQYYIKLINEDGSFSWLKKYKAKSPREFIIYYDENDENNDKKDQEDKYSHQAGIFDGDDYIIQICQYNYALELHPASILNNQIIYLKKLNKHDRFIPIEPESLSVSQGKVSTPAEKISNELNIDSLDWL